MATRKRVVVTDQRFADVAAERAAIEAAGAELVLADCATADEVAVAVRGADVVLANLAPVDAAALGGLAPGAVVIRYGIGTDNVDLEAARRCGVRVANVPDYGADTVADHASAAMLSLLRRLPFYDRAIREEGWIAPDRVPDLPALSECTVGLIGVGRIGLAVAARLRAFGIAVIAADPFADPARLAEAGVRLVERDALLAAADGISLHLPATPATRRMIDRAALARCKPGAVLVNTSRGALVDEAALAEALAAGRLAGAALDVFDPEPLAPDSPLRTLPNVILTPHAAFYSRASLALLQRLAAEEAARALGGEALRCPVA